MDEQEIKANLCVYDSRNPDSHDLREVLGNDIPKKEKGCACDNCFYGRTYLAEELLKCLKIV
jgi:hypothetical protein